MWSEFARENQGETVLPARVLGRSLMAAVGDETVQELYRRMIERARAGAVVRFQYRCDAPDRRRVFRMDIHRLEGGAVEFASTLVQEETRPAVTLLEAAWPRDERLLRICSWCQQVAVSETLWVPVEVAVTGLHLMEAEKLPGITHGICPACEREVRTSMGLA